MVDATIVIDNLTVLEDKDVHKPEVLSGKPSEEGRGSVATSSKTEGDPLFGGLHASSPVDSEEHLEPAKARFGPQVKLALAGSNLLA